MIYFYFHSGSENHGCEALVRSISKVVQMPTALYTEDVDQEKKYQIEKVSNLHNTYLTKQYNFFKWTMLSVLIKLLLKDKNEKRYYHLLHDSNSSNDIYLCIGGDTYCYDFFQHELSYLNSNLNKRGKKTVLWGCSIDAKALEKSQVIEDLNRYSLIIARESITYDALVKSKINSPVVCYPDSAFKLDKIILPMPKEFKENNTVGINVSPLIMEHETLPGIVYQNFISLIQHIIETSDMNIALIPHVVWQGTDDRQPLSKLYNHFKHTHRVILIGDHNCMELKGYISRCRFFIGARTHATIAAYSTCVPTLVVGYSVKAQGIAKDIFGTFENYVLPAQTLQNRYDLQMAFNWLKNHEDMIRNHLQKTMPAYCARALDAKQEIKRLIGDIN